jgi:phospholipase/lecithinase/hemolysin
VGGNDVRDALVPGANVPLILQDAVTAIGANVGRLYAAGARKFLIWNSPNLAVTPAVRALDTVSPGAAAGAQLLSVLFNSGLAQALAAAPGALPGIDIVPFDAFTEINNIVANPAKFGLNDATTACITPNVPPFHCRQPDRHLFWDGIHPTRAGHAIAALLVGKTLLVELVGD